jgi:hypothetical protein
MGYSAWRAVLRLSQCLALVSIVSAAALAYPAPAQADWDGFRNYTYGSSSCSSGDYKDPLNYFFNTRNHDLGLESVAKGYIRYWPVYWDMPPTPADDQYMWSTNSGCHRQDDQLAEAMVGPKYHARLRQGPWVSDYWGYATAVGMHHDSIGWCGWFFHDVSDSFNSARDYAKTQFSNAGFSQQRYWVGNTQAMQQCDGRMTASDGYVWENHGY